MTTTHAEQLATAVRADGFEIPFLDFTWLTGASGSAAGAQLRSVVGMVLAVALIVCAVALLVGLVGWIAARAGNGSEKAQSLFGGMAGLAVIGALLIGSLSAVATWGADDQLRAWFGGGGGHGTFAPGGQDGDLPDDGKTPKHEKN